MFRCVEVAIRRDSPFAARMLADQLVLRTEQPFPKPLLDFAGALTTQGPNLFSIVRHGTQRRPRRSRISPNVGLSAILPTARAASSGVRVVSMQIPGTLRLLALLTAIAVEPFPWHRSEKSRPGISHKSKIAKCGCLAEAVVAS